MRIAIQGELGSFSHEAALQMARDLVFEATIVPWDTESGLDSGGYGKLPMGNFPSSGCCYWNLPSTAAPAGGGVMMRGAMGTICRLVGCRPAAVLLEAV